MSSGQLAGRFADAPYAEQLGFEVDGNDAAFRAAFDEGNGYEGRPGEVVRRMGRFEEMMWGGIMPDMELRKQAVPTRIGWPGRIGGSRAVIDRQGRARGRARGRAAATPATRMEGGGRTPQLARRIRSRIRRRMSEWML